MDEGFLHIFLRYAQEISCVRASVIIDKVFESIQLLFLGSIVWNSFFLHILSNTWTTKKASVVL